MALPGSGALSYNGVVFDSLVKTKVSGKPVLDDARRMVKYVAWTIDVRAYVNAGQGTTTDATLAEMRYALTAVGKTLRYNAKGFGTLDVNGDTAVVDANWGPIPELLSFVPIGDAQTALVEWKVTTHIPECPGDTKYERFIMAFCYEVDYSIDSGGWTVVRTTGSIEIPLTHTPGGGPPTDIVDAYRERVRPEPLLGFQREQTYHISKNRARLDFNVTDTELPVALPPETNVADVEHTIKAKRQTGFNNIDCTLSGTIRVVAGKAKSIAFDRFRLILARRLAVAQVLALPLIIVGPAVAVRRNTILIEEVTYTESIFGKDSRFSVSYRVIQNVGFAGSAFTRMIESTGLWKPIVDWNHNLWRASMENARVLSVRGAAQLRMLAANDVLVDLCNVKQPEIRQPGPPTYRNSHNISGTRQTPPTVDPEASWVGYQCRIALSQESFVARHIPLAAPYSPTFQLPTFIAVDQANSGVRHTEPPGSDYRTPQGHILQETASPSVRLTLYGFGLRVGWRVDPPQLVSVGGVTCREVHRVFDDGIHSSYGDVPLYFARWAITYELPSPIAALPVPGNPQLGLAGGRV